MHVLMLIKLRYWRRVGFLLIREKRDLLLCIVWHSLIEQIGTLEGLDKQGISGLKWLELRLIMWREVHRLSHKGLMLEIKVLVRILISCACIERIRLVYVIH